MKKKKVMGAKKKQGLKYQSLKVKVVTLLQQRNDVSRQMLPSLLNATQECVDMALTSLRKAGFRIFPVRGPGTPLRIASSRTESEKYIMWRRRRYLPTTIRMIAAEHEIGEEYRGLATRSSELLEAINNTTSNR